MIEPANNHSTFKQIQEFLAKRDICLFTEKITKLRKNLPAEKALTRNSNKKRQLEFSTGRFCAHKALPKKFNKTPILQGTKKCPLWPAGYCGSITHSNDYACAATASRNNLQSLGIDLESMPRPISKNAYSWITNDEERTWINETQNIDFYSKLIFSAKESIFKLIYPITKKFFSFDAVSLCKPVEANTFIAKINIEQDRILFRKDTYIHGFFFYSDNWIFTISFLKEKDTEQRD